jgi:hypothetical protein
MLYIDSHYMLALSRTVASRYCNCFTYGSASPINYGYLTTGALLKVTTISFAFYEHNMYRLLMKHLLYIYESVSKNGMIDKQWTGNNIEDSGHSLSWGAMLVSAWRDWGKQRKPPLMNACLLVEIRTDHFPNTQKRYHLDQLTWGVFCCIVYCFMALQPIIVPWPLFQFLDPKQSI